MDPLPLQTCTVKAQVIDFELDSADLMTPEDKKCVALQARGM